MMKMEIQLKEESWQLQINDIGSYEDQNILGSTSYLTQLLR